MLINPDHSGGKITPAHRQRQSFVYIRQSSIKQVEEHLESQDLQYKLADRALALGWRKDQVTVIDDDLGKSGASTEGRDGFKLLAAEVALAHVGIILVTDVSRLARNSADWHQLLNIARLFGTLIADASGIYDPQLFDDRLLLGMKGAFAKAQLHSMHTQLHAARVNKARRGELHLLLPVGFERLPTGDIVKSPDADVTSAIDMVFAQFDRLGSAHQVLRYFRQHDLPLPRARGNGALREIVWEKASFQAVYGFLKQATYTGVYTYGKQRSVPKPGAVAKMAHKAVPIEDWPVVLHDAFPGYISWERYMQNQRLLRENAQNAPSPDAPRNGFALLAGLVSCAHCGRPMHVHYTHSPAYVCDGANREFDEPRCARFALEHVDAAVTGLLLETLQPAHLDAAIAAAADIDAQRAALGEHWRMRIARAQYDADLARRRHAKADPDLRLVAHSLEKDWEAKLTLLHGLEREFALVQASAAAPLSAEDHARIRALASDIPALWLSPLTTHEDRKRLLRCLIQDVTLDRRTQPGFSMIAVRWITGAICTLTVARPKMGGPPAPTVLLERIRLLAQTHTDDQIADLLNAEGTPMARNTGPWTLLRVRHFRNKHRIPSATPYTTRVSGLVPRGDGLYKTSAVAQALDTGFSVVLQWYKLGVLAGHKASPRSPLWLRFDPDDRARLDGSAALSRDMLPLQLVVDRLGFSPDQLRDAIARRQLFAYRIRIGNAWRWFLKPAPDSPFRKFFTL
jgi:DNA invertase Pin-like site-specific DNA recombinase